MSKQTEAKSIPGLTTIDQIDSAKLISSGYESHSGELLKLEEGQAIQGVYKAKSTFESIDQRSGEMKAINVFELETAPGHCVRLTATTALDQAFSKIQLGMHVVVARHADKSIANGKRKMHDFKVFSKAMKN